MNIWSDIMNNLLAKFLENEFLLYGVMIFVVVMIILFVCIIYSKSKDHDLEVEEETRKKKALFHKVKDEVEEEIKITKLTEDSEGGSVDLEALLEQMQTDLNNSNSKEDVIANFEHEQEEKAIISYQELVRANRRENDKETCEPLQELIQKIDQGSIIEEAILDVEESEDVDLFEEMKFEDEKKFKNTEFISPVFGKMDTNIEYPTIPPVNSRKARNKQVYDMNNIELEKTLDIEPINEEIQKNDEFLQSLKEFRKNLQ